MKFSKYCLWILSQKPTGRFHRGGGLLWQAKKRTKYLFCPQILKWIFAISLSLFRRFFFVAITLSHFLGLLSSSSFSLVSLRSHPAEGRFNKIFSKVVPLIPLFCRNNFISLFVFFWLLYLYVVVLHGANSIKYSLHILVDLPCCTRHIKLSERIIQLENFWSRLKESVQQVRVKSSVVLFITVIFFVLIKQSSFFMNWVNVRFYNVETRNGGIVSG